MLVHAFSPRTEAGGLIEFKQTASATYRDPISKKKQKPPSPVLMLTLAARKTCRFEKWSIKKKNQCAGLFVVALAYNPSTWKRETGGLP